MGPEVRLLECSEITNQKRPSKHHCALNSKSTRVPPESISKLKTKEQKQTNHLYCWKHTKHSKKHTKHPKATVYLIYMKMQKTTTSKTTNTQKTLHNNSKQRNTKRILPQLPQHHNRSKTIVPSSLASQTILDSVFLLTRTKHFLRQGFHYKYLRNPFFLKKTKTNRQNMFSH